MANINSTMIGFPTNIRIDTGLNKRFDTYCKRNRMTKTAAVIEGIKLLMSEGRRKPIKLLEMIKTSKSKDVLLSQINGLVGAEVEKLDLALSGMLNRFIAENFSFEYTTKDYNELMNFVSGDTVSKIAEIMAILKAK